MTILKTKNLSTQNKKIVAIIQSSLLSVPTVDRKMAVFKFSFSNKKLEHGSIPEVWKLPKRPEIQRPKVETLPRPPLLKRLEIQQPEVETLPKKHISI
jgi:hypothetical protein